LLLVSSGSPESRNIPKEFDSLLAFLGRGRTTGGRKGKRNGGERKSSEKGREMATSETERMNGRQRRRKGTVQERTKKRNW